MKHVAVRSLRLRCRLVRRTIGGVALLMVLSLRSTAGATPRLPTLAEAMAAKRDVWGELVGAVEEQMLLSDGNHVYLMMRPGVDLKIGQSFDRGTGEVRDSLDGGEIKVNRRPAPRPAR